MRLWNTAALTSRSMYGTSFNKHDYITLPVRMQYQFYDSLESLGMEKKNAHKMIKLW